MTLSLTDCTVNWSGAVVGLGVEVQAVTLPHMTISEFDTQSHTVTFAHRHSSYKYNKNSPVCHRIHCLGLA